MLNNRSRNNCEQEAKFLQERLINAERKISELCVGFSQYSRKLAKLRDEGDELSKITYKFSENEGINRSLSTGFENFSKSLQLLSDYGDSRVRSIDDRVVSEFSKYDNICKNIKDEVKQIYNARDKEISKKRNLDRLRERNPKNRQQIVQAETELIRATSDVTKTVHNLEEKTTNFEKQKLHDIKEILKDFVVIEIGYHAKALQVLTKTYESIQKINEVDDLEDFKRCLHSADFATKNSIFKAPSLGSLGAIFSSNHQRKTPGIPGGQRRSQSHDNIDSLRSETISDTDEITQQDDSEFIASESESTVNKTEVYRGKFK